jgi:hypothetical protein
MTSRQPASSTAAWPLPEGAQLPVFVVFDLIFVAGQRIEKNPEKFLTPIQGVASL